MKKNKLVCLSLPFIAVMAIACSGEKQQTELVAEESSTTVATEAASEAQDEETEYEETKHEILDKEFYYHELKDNKEEKIDLGSDGEMDTLIFKYPAETDKDKSCCVQINDQTIPVELIEENGVLMGDANAVFVHRSKGDFLFLTNSGDSGYGSVTLYMWDNGNFVEKDKYADSHNIHSTFNKKTNSMEYDIYDDCVILTEAEPVSFFGCDWIKGVYHGYGSDGFMLPWIREARIYPLIQGDNIGLILKKDFTFIEDDSGDGPKTGKAGQKIIPYGFQISHVRFVSEDGESLGYINDYETDPEELFENIDDFRVG